MDFRKTLNLIIAIFLSTAVFAQPGGFKNHKSLNVYVRVYGSYGFLAPGSFKGNAYLHGGEPVKFKVAKNGMGNGLYYGAGVGIILNEFWNVGISGEYLMGDKINVQQKITATESLSYKGSGYALDASRTFNYKIVSIIPSLTFKAISQESFYIYNRLGLQVGFPLSMTEENYQHYLYHNNNPAPHTIQDKDIVTTAHGKHTLKPGVGYQFSTGLQVILTEKLRAFFEISANRISYDRDIYMDIDRVQVSIETNKDELPQPAIYNYSKIKEIYINSGATGTNIRGVANNYLYTYRKPQEPVVVNSLTAGIGITYVF